MLAKQILNIIPDFPKNEVYYNIERAHRQPLNQNSKSRYKTPVTISKFANWSFSKKVKSGIIEKLQNGNTQTMVYQIYSKKLSKRRNKAFEHRKEMKHKTPKDLVGKGGHTPPLFLRFPHPLSKNLT